MRTLCTRHRHYHRRQGKLGIVLETISHHLKRNLTTFYVLTFIDDLSGYFSFSCIIGVHTTVKHRIECHTTRVGCTCSTMVFIYEKIPLPNTNDILRWINHCDRQSQHRLKYFRCLSSINSIWREEIEAKKISDFSSARRYLHYKSNKNICILEKLSSN